MNPAMLTNINAKRSNQLPGSSRAAETYEEPEFSYSDVLTSELSQMSKQLKRSNSDSARSGSNTNVDNGGKVSFQDIKNSSFAYSEPSIKTMSLTDDKVYTVKSDAQSLMDWVNKLIEEKTILKGDANGDGVVDLNDLKTMVDRMFDDNVDIKIKNVDFDGDGKITLQDIFEVIKILVNPDDNTDINNKTDDPVEPDPPPKQILKGDANGDGKVNYRDVKAIELAEINLGGKIDRKAADMDDDGDITSVDVSKAKKLANEYEAKFQKIVGDSNGDGVVDERDYNNVKNYINNVDSSEDFVLKNSDINGDGQVDDEDLKRLRDLTDGLNVNYDKSGLIGDANGDGEVTIQDVQAINNYKNRKATGKEIIFNNADINKDGKIDAEDVEATLEIIRNQIDPDPDPIPIPIVPSWKKQAGEYIPAYDDAKLENRIGNEAVFKGDKITVIAETDKSYQVIYPTSNGDKIRWISKTAKLENYDEPYVFPDHVSEKGIALIKRFEGFRDTAYKALPSEKYYTIGYGHYGPDVKPGMKITEAQAESLLRQDLISAENSVKKYCSHLKLNQNQFDALVSFTFNCGAGNLQKLVRNNRSIEEIAESLPYYRTAGGKVVQGLVNRRAAELELFNTPVNSTQNVQSSTSATLQKLARLQSLIDQWNGKTWKDHTYLSNVSQCKEFASYIFNELYGTGYIGSGSVSSNYYNWRLSGTPSNVYQVAEVKPTFNKNTAKNAFKEMFANAQPGDFIQIKRGTMSPHSAIFVGWTEDGIQWLDANADNKNGIKLQTYTYDDLVKTTNSGHQWNVAMSLYRAK